jgi:hypothetical protein
LRNIGKDAVDHADQHTVLEGVTRILDNGDDVCAVGSHVDQITSGAMRELDGEDGSLGSDNVGNVRNTGTRRSTKIQNFAARAHVDVVNTTKDTGCQFTPEGVPDAVFDAAGCGVISVAGVGGGTNTDTLLAVDALARSQVLGDEQIFLSTGDENTGVAMGLNNDLAVGLLDSQLSWKKGYHIRSTTSSSATSTTGRTTTAASTAVSTTATTASTTIAKSTTAAAASATVAKATSSATGSESTATTTVTTATATTIAETTASSIETLAHVWFEVARFQCRAGARKMLWC